MGLAVTASTQYKVFIDGEYHGQRENYLYPLTRIVSDYTQVLGHHTRYFYTTCTRRFCCPACMLW